MKLRKILSVLFFLLGLAVFLFVLINFFSQLFIDKNLFTASLAQNIGKKSVINITDGVRDQDVVEEGINNESDLVLLPDTDQLLVDENVVFVQAAIDKQDQIDDILEKIDILQQEIADLEKDGDEKKEEVDIKEDKVEDSKTDETEAPEVVKIVIVDKPSKTYNFGANHQLYPKILISEVQIGGIKDAKQEFVELYNPNDEEVDLTGWYLQRKTKTGSNYSSFASSTLFVGKKITAKGYFLIARQGSDFAFHIQVKSSLTEDNSLILKSPQGEIEDKVGWGVAQDFETSPAQNPLPGQSIGREHEVDTNNNVADFILNIPTPTGKNIPYEAPPEDEPKDILPPEVTFSTLASMQPNLSFTVNFDIKDVALGIAPSGIAGYTLRHQEEAGDWIEDEHVVIDGSTVTFPGSKNFTGQDEKNYSFQIKSNDTAGNESDWQPEIPITTKISLVKKVLINEIQVTGATAKDEFIELYNPSAVNIDLTGFALKKKTASGTESNLVSSGSFSGIIPAHGYFLIVPPDNDEGSKNYTGSVAPDLYYSGQTFSIASSNTVLLYDKNDLLIDKVGFGIAEDFETAAAPDPLDSKSIGRIKNADNEFEDTDNNAIDFVAQDSNPHNSDVILPQILNIQVLHITENSAQISWETDEMATSFIGYGQDIPYDLSVPLDVTLMTAHTMTLSGLSADIEYHYQIKSQDANGNEAISLDQTFTTLAPIDVTPPLRSNGLPGGLLASGTTQVEISVVTDESATCKYSTLANQLYGQIADTLVSVDGLYHSVSIEELVDGSEYTYYVVCADVLNNINPDDFAVSFGVALPDEPLPPPPPPITVVINEIAWMGTTVSSSNEWIELYNPGDQLVDLSGWRLVATDGTPIISLSKTIDARGFYLLERTDDNSVLETPADQIYTGALGNGGEQMFLYDGAGSIKDEIDCGTGWFAGDNTAKKTMQRIDATASGNSASNWQTSPSIGGTPRY